MIYGYARVSTKNQMIYGNSLEQQENQLREAGAIEIYKDAFTGTKDHRPNFDKLMSLLAEGDCLMVTKLDRLARSFLQGSKIVSDLIDIYEHVDKPFELHQSLVIDNSKEEYHFYVRVNKNELMNDICLSYEEDETYIYMKTRKMTIVDLLNHIKDKDCFIAIL